MKNLIVLFFIAFSFQSICQGNLAEKELILKQKLEELRNAKTDYEINRINASFQKEIFGFLQTDGAFQHVFSQLKTVAVIDSPDHLVRIVHWNLEYKDFTYAYCGYIMRWDPDKETCKIYELIDNMDPYTAKPEGIIDVKNWYGALYYKIIPVENDAEMQYVLLGWDGATSGSNFKIIDVLSFKGSLAKLGAPLFLNKNKLSKRVIFEYSDKSVMSMSLDTKRDRIVFDHLSPENPVLTGVFSYYIPDFSYDAYVWEEDKFVLHEDVIANNDPQTEKTATYYTFDSKTGKVKKNEYKAKWINPEDPNKKGDIGHVARTPDSEINTANNEATNETPRKRWFDRRNPDNLSVTTGKYRKNRRRAPAHD